MHPPCPYCPLSMGGEAQRAILLSRVWSEAVGAFGRTRALLLLLNLVCRADAGHVMWGTRATSGLLAAAIGWLLARAWWCLGDDPTREEKCCDVCLPGRGDGGGSRYGGFLRCVVLRHHSAVQCAQSPAPFPPIRGLRRRAQPGWCCRPRPVWKKMVCGLPMGRACVALVSLPRSPHPWVG